MRFTLNFSTLSILALCATLSACSSINSTLQGDKVDYRTAIRGTNIDVPPDLTQITRDNQYLMSGGAVNATGYEAGKSQQSVQMDNKVAGITLGDMRIERVGNQRWLIVNQSADKLWPIVRDFWLDSGFLLTTDQANLGIMETDWAENRANIPQDIIRSTIGKVLDSVFDTGLRDKYRTRVERVGKSGESTEIYISHRGMEEVYTSTAKDRTMWQPRPTDGELENEFLRRLMVRLGAKQEQVKTLVASDVKATSRVTQLGAQAAVQIDDGFDRAWRRVGLTLDRTGFTVEDRDRAQGLYFVRYVPLDPDKKTGFFSKLFSQPEAAASQKYRIAIKSQGEQSIVTVLNNKGEPESSINAERIVKVIADDLK